MVLDSFLVALFSLRLSSGVLWFCHVLLSLRFSAIFLNMYWGYSCLLMDAFASVEKRIAFIMLVFRSSVTASISSLVFSEVEAEVVRVKTSLKSCQLVCWL